MDINRIEYAGNIGFYRIGLNKIVRCDITEMRAGEKKQNFINKTPCNCMQITILGAGKIGQAIASGLSEHVQCFFWDKVPGKVPDQLPFDVIIPKSSVVFFCIPTSGVCEAMADVKPFLSKNALVVSVSKGVDTSKGTCLYRLFDEHVSDTQYALLFGPMLADECLQKKGAAAVVASKNPEAASMLQSLFQPHFIRLEYSDDVRSVAMAGLLKNVYTLAIGICDGLSYGNNMKGYLASLIIREAGALAKLLNIDVNILVGTAGMADFIATAFSPYSRNREVGAAFGRGDFGQKSEGAISLPALIRMLPDTSSFPILASLASVVIDHASTKDTFEKLLFRE